MGCGKTSVGGKLAEITGRAFVDMDRFIEQSEGATVSQIFAERGEADFRRLECEAVKTLSRKSGLIIAAGGGTLMNPDNAAALKETGTIILLDAGLDAIRSRLKGDRSRPLLAGQNRDEVMEQLYIQRIDAYRAAADFFVPADDGIDAVAQRIQILLG
jgi:shikimate kinase